MKRFVQRIFAIILVGACSLSAAFAYYDEGHILDEGYKVVEGTFGQVVYAMTEEDRAALSYLGREISVIDHGQNALNTGESDVEKTTFIQVSYINVETKEVLTAADVLQMEQEEARNDVSLLVWRTAAYQHGNTNYIGFEIKVVADDLRVTIKSVDVSITYVDISDMRPTWSESFTFNKVISNWILDAYSVSKFSFPDNSQTQVSWECEIDLGDWTAIPSTHTGSAVVEIK